MGKKKMMMMNHRSKCRQSRVVVVACHRAWLSDPVVERYLVNNQSRLLKRLVHPYVDFGWNCRAREVDEVPFDTRLVVMLIETARIAMDPMPPPPPWWKVDHLPRKRTRTMRI